MRYFALACDFDGTLTATHEVSSEVLERFERLRATGRRLILVTGRTLDQLLPLLPQIDLFDRVVAENGAVLYQPATREETLLAKALPQQLVEALRARGVQPLEQGKVILATWQPNEITALEVIRDLGLDFQVLFNNGAVMLLPAGVTKATGLSAALKELDLSPRNVVGVGNAENDHSFLDICECSVAVANAIGPIRESVDFSMRKMYGAGIVELIDEILDSDLAAREYRLGRHHLFLGTRANGAEVRIRPYGANLLIAGPSASGKSSAATAFIERLVEHKYQFCVIDPEGDYTNLDSAIVLGNGPGAPTVDETVRLLKEPNRNVVVNLLNIPLDERPSYFLTLLPRLQELRATTGRPHWIIIDEAHHLLPASWQPADLVMSQSLEGMLLVTVHPDHVAPSFLSLIDAVIAVGHTPEETIQEFCNGIGRSAPPLDTLTRETGDVLYWSRESDAAPVWMRVIPSRLERRRHRRKYAGGEVSNNSSFYFRGPDNRLNLRAQNLILFMQLSEGIDDATWLYHLHRGDYARWFRKVIKDKALAARAAEVQKLDEVSAHDSRRLISEAIQEHYTLPA